MRPHPRGDALVRGRSDRVRRACTTWPRLGPVPAQCGAGARATGRCLRRPHGAWVSVAAARSTSRSATTSRTHRRPTPTTEHARRPSRRGTSGEEHSIVYEERPATSIDGVSTAGPPRRGRRARAEPPSRVSVQRVGSSGAARRGNLDARLHGASATSSTSGPGRHARPATRHHSPPVFWSARQVPLDRRPILPGRLDTRGPDVRTGARRRARSAMNAHCGRSPRARGGSGDPGVLHTDESRAACIRDWLLTSPAMAGVADFQLTDARAS